MKQIKILFFILLFIGASGSAWAQTNCKVDDKKYIVEIEAPNGIGLDSYEVKLKITHNGKVVKTSPFSKYEWESSDNASLEITGSDVTSNMKGKKEGSSTVTVKIYDQDDKLICEPYKDIKILDIKIDGPDLTSDGANSKPFKIVLPDSIDDSINGNIVWYKWEWEAPNNFNQPNVDFSTPKDKETIVDQAKWFPFEKDSPWQKQTGRYCEYTIMCQVTVDGQDYEIKHQWGVEVPTVKVLTGGKLKEVFAYVRSPSFEGYPTIEYDKDKNEHYISSWSTYKRGAPPLSMGNIEVLSQFYVKIYAHEKRHVDQFTKKSLNFEKPYNLMRVNNISADIGEHRKETGVYNDYKRNLDTAIKNWVSTEMALYNIWSQHTGGNEMEFDAHTISNAIEPFYLQIDPKDFQ